MAIKLRVEVTDEDGTIAEYRVEDAVGDVNTAGRLAWLVGYAYRAMDPFLCGEWDDLLVSLVDSATETNFRPLGDDAVCEAYLDFMKAANELAQAKVAWRMKLDSEQCP